MLNQGTYWGTANLGNSGNLGNFRGIGSAGPYQRPDQALPRRVKDVSGLATLGNSAQGKPGLPHAEIPPASSSE